MRQNVDQGSNMMILKLTPCFYNGANFQKNKMFVVLLFAEIKTLVCKCKRDNEFGEIT